MVRLNHLLGQIDKSNLNPFKMLLFDQNLVRQTLTCVIPAGVISLADVGRFLAWMKGVGRRISCLVPCGVVNTTPTSGGPSEELG